METRDDKYAGLIRKLVANARAIISDEVGISIGVQRMCNILTWLKPYTPVKGRYVKVFEEYYGRIQLVPIGSARLHCSKEAFERYDQALQDVNKALRTKVLAACFEIIDAYGEDTATQL